MVSKVGVRIRTPCAAFDILSHSSVSSFSSLINSLSASRNPQARTDIEPSKAEFVDLSNQYKVSKAFPLGPMPPVEVLIHQPTRRPVTSSVSGAAPPPFVPGVLVTALVDGSVHALHYNKGKSYPLAPPTTQHLYFRRARLSWDNTIGIGMLTVAPPAALTATIWDLNTLTSIAAMPSSKFTPCQGLRGFVHVCADYSCVLCCVARNSLELCLSARLIPSVGVGAFG